MQGDVTRLLSAIPGGDDETREALLARVYGELRRLARSHMRRERGDHTLGATGLVHEAWIRLQSSSKEVFSSRAHFFGAASQAMRRVLVDYARARASRKRQGQRVTLTSIDGPAAHTPPLEEVLDVDAALAGLTGVSDRLVQVVECRYFAGLTIVETAEALNVSHATVSEDWRFARAWLRRALSEPRRKKVA